VSFTLFTATGQSKDVVLLFLGQNVPLQKTDKITISSQRTTE